jgi:hypothetical protein
MSKKKNKSEVIITISYHKSSALIRLQSEINKMLRPYEGTLSKYNAKEKVITMVQDLTKWTPESIDYFIILPSKIKQSREYTNMDISVFLPIHWREFYYGEILMDMMNSVDIKLYVDNQIIN